MSKLEMLLREYTRKLRTRGLGRVKITGLILVGKCEEEGGYSADPCWLGIQEEIFQQRVIVEWKGTQKVMCLTSGTSGASEFTQCDS